MKLTDSIGAFAQAALSTRSLNVRGFPLIPKQLWRSAPFHRTSYNQFLLWIGRLHLQDVGQVIDVGANHGDFAQAASTLFPDARVLLVEPLPSLHPELERRSADYPGRWSVAKCAVGAEAGETSLFVDPQMPNLASLTGFTEQFLKAMPGANPSQTLTCSVVRLDDLTRERGIGKVDLLKIDVEGFEFEVLKGAGETLARCESVVIEISLIRRVDAQNSLELLLALLRERGFAVVDVLPSYFDPEIPWRPIEFNVLGRRL